jgi:hypothetical protein
MAERIPGASGPALDDDMRELAVKRTRRLMMLVQTAAPETATAAEARRIAARKDDPVAVLARMCEFSARHAHLAGGRVGLAAESLRPVTLRRGVESWREARRRGLRFAQPHIHICPHPDEVLSDNPTERTN